MKLDTYTPEERKARQQARVKEDKQRRQHSIIDEVLEYQLQKLRGKNPDASKLSLGARQYLTDLANKIDSRVAKES